MKNCVKSDSGFIESMNILSVGKGKDYEPKRCPGDISEERCMTGNVD